ncbi:MAG TPA: cell division protein FtsZ, partial [Dehalococcoidia bacterium]|nr:cell division protein FtsZ [Dehalococcoidia bacterium]
MVNETFMSPLCRIKAVGVGGGGCNAINRMVRAEVPGVDFIVINTDALTLRMSPAPLRVQIGEKLTRGLGAGGDPAKGNEAAEESREELQGLFHDTDIVFIAAGMGGGTGTGAAPLVAKLAKDSGALTVAIVTKPFSFELARRIQVAEGGIEQLKDNVDALITIPNERLLQITGDKVTVDDAFKVADDIIATGIRAITTVITEPGLIKLDFADVRTIMEGAGSAWMSIGYGTGRDRVVEATRSAINSPLLEVSVNGAGRAWYIITGPADLTLAEVNEAATIIRAAVSQEANLIFGVSHDPKMNNDVRIILFKFLEQWQENQGEKVMYHQSL